MPSLPGFFYVAQYVTQKVLRNSFQNYVEQFVLRNFSERLRRTFWVTYCATQWQGRACCADLTNIVNDFLHDVMDDVL